ncbi:fibrinogen-like YCDxxxxGGGW domain-containing protein [Pyxidicoccus sp. MSG2]|uniref:fibrinogen-like YCDxxxxGGGW domain-containing protein n=1 Tax=Pyxidicoccus sp. MSG2 TaxID=2996790 RepID=UPI00226EDF03|nr:fibrinogen-like YCDxxxxGGGW domain-containing protein [Pyxidicoccus sp. MSG2]MCY1023918.1 fibrinogen-like YCDxxxxGGGW domain-containing protein [Pyxidicoccus sp. MSG2]
MRSRRHLFTTGLLAICTFLTVNCRPEDDLPTSTSLKSVSASVTEAPPEILPSEFIQDITGALSEGESVPANHPEYLSSTLNPDILITTESDIWVTFVSETATFLNSFGYFTYTEGTPPTSAATVEKILVFENSSAWGSGGPLRQGDRMLLGRFPAGTRIGFFLVSNGWDWGTVDFSRLTYYSIDAFNPESLAEQRRHVVSLYHPGTHRRVLAFEDFDRSHEQNIHNFSDLIVSVSSNPATGIEPSGPSIPEGPCPGAPPAALQSCRQLHQFCPELPSGTYELNPCGSEAKTHYCDMTSSGGGWTVAGWQTASAKTSLGVSDRGTPGSSDWSRNLSCVQFSEVQVFNRTYNEAFTQSYSASTWNYTATNMAFGSPGTAFKQGVYGPTSSRIMMGCINYSYNGGVVPEAACDSDWQSGARGHLADYAGEYCSGGRLDFTWAWSNGTTCRYRGQPYIWGFAIR